MHATRHDLQSARNIKKTYLKEAQAVEEATNVIDGSGTLDKSISDPLVHNQIEMSVSVTALEIFEAKLGSGFAPLGERGNLLFGSRELMQIGSEQYHFTRADGQLAFLGAHGETFDADDVTAVKVVVDTFKVFFVVGLSVIVVQNMYRQHTHEQK